MDDESRNVNAEAVLAQRMAELERREAALAQRELQSRAAQLLQERSLPAVLIQALNCGSPEALEKSIDAAETAFREAVRLGIGERMKGSVPKTGAENDDTDDSDEAYYARHYGQ